MSKRSAVLLLFAASIAGVLLYPTLSRAVLAQSEFRPASFSGLTIGKATIANLRRMFGKPADINQDNSGTTYLHYRDIGPVRGEVEIQADSKTQVIGVISITPDDLTVERAEAIYGPNFRIVRYAFDECLDIGGNAPIYESPTGPLQFIVYPASGIAILQKQDRVMEIEYRSEPLGPKESQCKGKEGK